jgi:hypothetical protein
MELRAYFALLLLSKNSFNSNIFGIKRKRYRIDSGIDSFDTRLNAKYSGEL